MSELLAWLEASSLGHTMRNAGVWSYGITNLVHILGIATLFGSILLLDLRLLGLWRTVPLRALATAAVPTAGIGVAVAIVSGICLLSTNASEYVGNPFLPIKLGAIGLGLANALVLSFTPAWRAAATRGLEPRERRQLAAFGGLSLIAWLTALGAGRMIGYW